QLYSCLRTDRISAAPLDDAGPAGPGVAGGVHAHAQHGHAGLAADCAPLAGAVRGVHGVPRRARPLPAGAARTDRLPPVDRARPTRFAVTLGVMLLIFTATAGGGGRVLYAERNFFGVIRVQDDRTGRFRLLNHGSTLHGLQRLGPDGQPERSPEPLSYFHRSG